MRYFVCANRCNTIDIIEKYDLEETALKRLKYHLKKEKCGLVIIPVPELKVGCTIYRSDKSYYGRIEYETANLWGILCDDKEGRMPDPYGKQRIDGWIINHGLIITGCEESPDVNTMMENLESLNKRVEQALDSLQGINAEQVTFFR
jgi:hypothetical protein